MIDFRVLWQSHPTQVVSSFKEALPLYCISSAHNSCTYHWKDVEDSSRQFTASPVVYVNKSGVYQCTVMCGTSKVSAKLISVVVALGKYTKSLIFTSE